MAFFKKNLSKQGILEQLKKVLTELKEDSKKKPVIVEGKKDSSALEKFGINSVQLHKVNSSLGERIEELSKNKECILLFDLDRQGKKLHEKIRDDLHQCGVRVDSRYRNFLLSKTKLRFIEGLDTYFENLLK